MSSPGVCLQLDIGNTRAKWRLVNGNKVISRGDYQPNDESSQQRLLNCCESLDHIWISSVTTAASELLLSRLLENQWGIVPWFARSESRTGSLINSYEEPSRMGVDRWLAMLAGRERKKSRLCVIDSGSALTIDIVSADGRHEGGYIIPGAALMDCRRAPQQRMRCVMVSHWLRLARLRWRWSRQPATLWRYYFAEVQASHLWSWYIAAEKSSRI
jgi:pantothenate kinase type III